MSRKARRLLDLIRGRVGEVIVGLDSVVDMMLVGLISGGHILLEGPPGLGKTTLAKTFAGIVGGSFNRIQMTPDLLPSDVLGVNVYNPFDYTWVLRRGPVFANVVLIDELNRASPRVQSAFLQVMQERMVTIESETLDVPLPFLVVATQLPFGELGTYPLTGVQIDRFAYRVSLNNPEIDDEVEIVARVDSIDDSNPSPVTSSEDVLMLMEQVRKMHVEPVVLKYIVELVHDIRSSRYIRMGPSPRASIWLYKGCRALALMEGRNFVTPDDVKKLAPYVISHRVELNQMARVDEVDVNSIIDESLSRVAVPKGLD